MYLFEREYQSQQEQREEQRERQIENPQADSLLNMVPHTWVDLKTQW